MAFFRSRPAQAGAIAVGLGLMLAGPALADPCTAPLPRAGAQFKGPVRYVGDGDSLCIGPTMDPSTWIEVRLADFYAPELSERGGRKAKSLLEDVTFRQHLTCRAQKRSYDRVVARCTIGGASVGDLLRARGGREGGQGFKKKR
ncbi:MAG: nuclease [Caulobacter sp.]